ncbi:hypothetical protein BDP27DRAFT_1368417 [Rhodocollybia butyracea]|uniref:Uncharacterized protein n=1 Tax=Rhodocollybia butyracea TaxID=206335 RepID=A0A9P5PFL6_9AGAR|nr:hypothetical protein BDP27DRAFT_1368417 [Rhodocollybia butyracea]
MELNKLLGHWRNLATSMISLLPSAEKCNFTVAKGMVAFGAILLVSVLLSKYRRRRFTSSEIILEISSEMILSSEHILEGCIRTSGLSIVSDEREELSRREEILHRRELELKGLLEEIEKRRMNHNRSVAELLADIAAIFVYQARTGRELNIKHRVVSKDGRVFIEIEVC